MVFRIMLITAAWVSLLAVVPPTSAQLASRKETLRGHRSVFVAVTTPESEVAVRQLGLVKPSLERYILAQLAKANIPASLEFTDQTLILEIQIDVHQVIQAKDLDVYAFVSRFDAIQPARLATNRQAALAVTWRNAIRRRNSRSVPIAA